MQIPNYVKELLLEDMNKFETERDHRSFTKRGEWTLSFHGHRNQESRDKLKWSIEMRFDRSIIIWHIPTHIRIYSCHEDSYPKEASKLMSDYMMLLLALHPQILSLTTAEITYQKAYLKFKTFLKQIQKEMCDSEDILKIL